MREREREGGGGGGGEREKEREGEREKDSEREREKEANKTQRKQISCYFFHLPDVHESQGSDVRRVGVIQHGIQLLPSELESEEFEEKTVRRGHYTSSSNSTYLWGA